jgi:hypothetical protein
MSKAKVVNQRIEFALNLLRTLGGDAMGEESEGKYFIRGNGCPLSAATADHLEACLIVEALLSEIIDSSASEGVSSDREVSIIFTANGPLIYRWESNNANPPAQACLRTRAGTHFAIH